MSANGQRYNVGGILLERGLVFAGGYREVMQKYLLRPYIRLDHDGD